MKFLKSFNFTNISLALAMILFASCSKDNVEDEVNTPELSVTNTKAEYVYKYQGKFYSAEDFETNHKDLLMSSFQVFDETEFGQIINVFEDEAKANKFTESPIDYSENTDTTSEKRATCPDKWGFKVRMWEHENYKGKWIQFRRVGIPGNLKRKHWNMPNGWKNRVSSIVADELDYPSNFTSRGCQVAFMWLTCYDGDNFRGRSVAASLFVVTHSRSRHFKNLRKGNWNDKINSFSMSY